MTKKRGNTTTTQAVDESVTVSDTQSTEVETTEVVSESEVAAEDVVIAQDDVVTEEPAVEEAVVEEPVVEEAVVEEKTYCSEQSRNMDATLKTYVDVMSAGNALSAAVIVAQQTTLVTYINTIPRLNPEDMEEVLTNTIETIREYRDTVFSEYNMFRRFNEMQMNNKRRIATTNILTLLAAAADVNRSKVRAQVDMDTILNSIESEDARQVFSGYFG